MTGDCDQPPPPRDAEPASERGGIDRRVLLAGATAAGTATVAWFWLQGFGDPLRRARLTPTPVGAPGRALDEAERATLAAAQERILPSAEGVPGARTVNAIGHLDAVLADPEVSPDHVRQIKDGARALDAASGGEPGSFARRDPEAQDAAIRAYETTDDGVAWLRLMVEFTTEALLGDPVYGINPDQAGWRWLEVPAPSPRPTAPWTGPPR